MRKIRTTRYEKRRGKEEKDINREGLTERRKRKERKEREREIGTEGWKEGCG